MEAFVSRKKRRLDPADAALELYQTDDLRLEEPVTSAENRRHEDEDDTDIKLATLASLHPDVDTSILLDSLISSDGSVAAAAKSLGILAEPARSPPPNIATPPPKPRTIGYQSSVLSYATLSAADHNNGNHDQDQNHTCDSGTNSPPRPPKRRLLTKKGQTLHLYSPADIAAHTPCTIIHNFLSQEQASGLLRELLVEAESFPTHTFRLFDRDVSSPHTACFFVENEAERRKIGTEYLYNGSYLTDIRQLTPQMRAVSSAVGKAVNEAIAERIRTAYPGGKKLRFQSRRAWKPNAAFVNCYDGGKQSVGYHSDQLTYLGPRAIIGSISLGVAREFRVRKIVAKGPPSKSNSDSNGNSRGPDSPGHEKKKAAPAKPGEQEDEEQKDEEEEEEDGEEDSPPAPAADEQGQIAIHLPHNSLLIMHAEMQEEWKHSIAPAQRIDPHPVAANKRLNITYRHYREEFHPRHTPRCGGHGVPAVLRCVQRQRATRGRYVWMCDVGQRVGSRDAGCGFFEWAVFDDDGDPPWIGDLRKEKEGNGEGEGEGGSGAEVSGAAKPDEDVHGDDDGAADIVAGDKDE